MSLSSGRRASLRSTLCPWGTEAATTTWWRRGWRRTSGPRARPTSRCTGRSSGRSSVRVRSGRRRSTGGRRRTAQLRGGRGENQVGNKNHKVKLIAHCVFSPSSSRSLDPRSRDPPAGDRAGREGQHRDGRIPADPGPSRAKGRQGRRDGGVCQGEAETLWEYFVLD